MVLKPLNPVSSFKSHASVRLCFINSKKEVSQGFLKDWFYILKASVSMKVGLENGID